MGENLGMFKKGLAIIAVPSLFQIAFFVALFALQRDSADARWWAIHTKEVIVKVEAVSRALAEAQGAVRGLLLTGDPAISEDYTRAASEISALIFDLQRLIEHNETVQRPRADALSREIAGYRAKLDHIYKLARAGRKDDALAAFQDEDRRQRLKSLREALAVFLATETDLDRQRTDRERTILRRQHISIVVGAVLSIAVAVAMVTAFSRGFTQRIDVLSENARRLAEGLPLAAPLTGLDEIGRLDAAFHGMASSIAEKDTENEMFIYSVSHDLRSPLVNLQGFAKELALTADDLRAALAGAPLPEKTRSRVETLLASDMATAIHFIQNAVTRLSSIIDSLLRLSRAGRVVLAKEAVDIQGVVGRVVEALSGTTSEQRVEMVVNGLPPALGDTTATEGIFANLVSNAVKYLDPARPGRVEIGVTEDSQDGPVSHPGMRTYYVKDNGLGIPPAYHSKLFLAFQRLHPGVASGEGIGLALVRRMVERQGGKVWVDSEEGRGSTFFVTLPALPPDQEPPPASVNGEAPSHL
jgi:signal transduction histidine kinase